VFEVVAHDADREGRDGIGGKGGGTKEEEVSVCKGTEESKETEEESNETFEEETTDTHTAGTEGTDTDDNEGDTDTHALPPFAKASPPTTDLTPVRSSPTLEEPNWGELPTSTDRTKSGITSTGAAAVCLPILPSTGASE
jgi:hypothetical protein